MFIALSKRKLFEFLLFNFIKLCSTFGIKNKIVIWMWLIEKNEEKKNVRNGPDIANSTILIFFLKKYRKWFFEHKLYGYVVVVRAISIAQTLYFNSVLLNQAKSAPRLLSIYIFVLFSSRFYDSLWLKGQNNAHHTIYNKKNGPFISLVCAPFHYPTLLSILWLIYILYFFWHFFFLFVLFQIHLLL